MNRHIPVIALLVGALAISGQAAAHGGHGGGGGWYGPNSSNPLENPTPVSNAIETIALVLIPMAVVFMAGGMLRRKKFTLMALVAMGLLSVSFLGATVYSELQPNAAFAGLSAQGPNMEGKEVRFGPELSALWASFTTQTSNGSVNAMHDSFNPIGGLMTRSGMGSGVMVRRLRTHPVARSKHAIEPWRFPVGPKTIHSVVRSCNMLEVSGSS